MWDWSLFITQDLLVGPSLSKHLAMIFSPTLTRYPFPASVYLAWPNPACSAFLNALQLEIMHPFLLAHRTVSITYDIFTLYNNSIYLICIYIVESSLKSSLIHFHIPHSTFIVTGILYRFNKYLLTYSIHKWVGMNPNLLSLNHHKFIFSDTCFHLFRTWSILNSNRCSWTAGRNYSADTKSSA